MPDRTSRWHILTALGIVLAGTCALWFRFNASSDSKDMLFPFDLIYYYYPMTEYAAERLAQGCIPLWNPHSACGTPFLATAQVGVFYPGTWLALLLPTGTAITVLMFGEVLLAGLFAALFYRASGAGGLASGIGGLLFVFACALGQTFWPPQVSAIVWMPFLFLCVENFVRRGTLRWWAAFTLGTTLQILAGFPQLLVYTFYLLVPYTILRLTQLGLSKQITSSHGLRRGACLAAACVFALGLSAVQLLPTLELTNNSLRSENLDEKAVHYLADEGAELVPGQLVRHALDTTPKLTTYDFLAGSGYLGASTIPLMALGLLAGRRRALVWFFLTGAVAFGLLSFGYHLWSGGLYRLYAVLPTGSMFRTPGRLRLLMFFCIISLVVMAIEQFNTGWPELRTDGRRHRIAALLLIGAWLSAMSWCSGVLGIILAVAFVALLAASWFGSRHGRLMLAAGTLLVLLVLLDLTHASAPRGVFRSLPLVAGRTFAVWLDAVPHAVMEGETLAALGEKAGLDRIALIRMRPEKPIRPIPRVYFFNDLEPLSPRRSMELYLTAGGSMGHFGFSLDPVQFRGVYDMASVKHAATPRRVPDGIQAMLETNAQALPRAYLAGGYEVCDAPVSLSRVLHPDFDYQNVVLVEKDPALAPLPPGTSRESASITSYSAEQVLIVTNSKEGRLLVLTDTWFPGWKAFVDGREEEILHANYLFRAVAVPAGRHEVVFEYHPASFRNGVIVSLTTLGPFVILTAAWSVRQRWATHVPR